MARRLIWALALAVAIAALGAAVTSTTAAAVPAVTSSTRTIATGAGPRPVHIVRIVPGRGVRLEAVWLGGGPGRTGTVGGYIRANAGRGAVAGLNGDFFLLGRNVPSGNLLIHKGRSFLGGTNRGAAAFGADGSVDIVAGAVKDADLIQEGVREAISGKPVYVHDGRVGDLTTLEPYQRDHAYHRTAVGRLRNGQTALVVIGGAGTSAQPVRAGADRARLRRGAGHGHRLQRERQLARSVPQPAGLPAADPDRNHCDPPRRLSVAPARSGGTPVARSPPQIACAGKGRPADRGSRARCHWRRTRRVAPRLGRFDPGAAP